MEIKVTKKIKRREFFKKSFGSVIIATGINGTNSSAFSLKSIKTKQQQKDKILIWVETSGNPAEIGFQYGSQLKDKLKEYCEIRTANIYKKYKKNILEKGKKVMLGVMEQEFPYIIKEMRGIAKGAEISYDDYSLSVISAGFSIFPKESDECSNILFKESDHGPLLGKTLDGTTPDVATSVVRLIKPKNGITVLCLTRIDGISTETGLNNKGLALGESSLHFFTTNPRGIIRTLLLRPLLSECSSVEEGSQYLAAHPTIKDGFHYTMVDTGGNIAIAERSPIEYNVRRTESKVIYCTNHTASPWMRKLEKSRGVEGDRNSDNRFQNLKNITSDDNFELSLKSMKKILRNHNIPGGICQHGNENLYTQKAYINIVNEGKLLVSPGPPCKNDFKEFVIG